MSTTDTTFTCENPDHDHDAYDEARGEPVPGTMTCADCGVPTHYDEGCSDYVHDDPDAPPCFLRQRGWPADASPCYAEVRGGVTTLSALRNLAHGAIEDGHHQDRLVVAFVDDHGRDRGTTTIDSVLRYRDGTIALVVVR